MADSAWERYQALTVSVPELGLLVDLSKTGLGPRGLCDDPLVAEAFPKAFASMADLEKGAVANPDEKRRVGHYWLRAPQLAPDAETRDAIATTLAAVKAFAADVKEGRVAPERAERFTNVLVVGIGGSALGPQ